jgi:NADPH-dependent curcumin reductase CurA
MTAYFGFLDVCEPKAGETVLVSGAAGAVGSLVGQLAKIHGLRAVGIAGGPAKCARLTEKYGFDAAIDYRGKDEAALTKAIAEACPDGVDVIFENVGGIILDAGLMNLNLHARVGLCGLISEYNTEPRGIRNLWQLIVKRAQIRGLLVSDYVERFGEGAQQMGVWAAQGRLTIDEHIDEGLENAFDSFMRLFAGTNDGKMILKIV